MPERSVADHLVVNELAFWNWARLVDVTGPILSVGGEAELRGAEVATRKSAWLSSVSCSPAARRKSAPKTSDGARFVPSYSLSLPYPTRSSVSGSAMQKAVVQVTVLVLSAMTPPGNPTVIVPVASGVGSPLAPASWTRKYAPGPIDTLL